MYRTVKAYRDNEVTTASKMKLVVMMYDGVIRFLKECLKRMEQRDIAGRGLYLNKAQRIVSELQESLNRDKGGEVAEQLEKVYGFIISRLTEANIKGDPEPVKEALSMLEVLKEGWVQVTREVPVAKPSTQVERASLAINL